MWRGDTPDLTQMEVGEAATQVWVELSRGALLEFEQAGIFAMGRGRDSQTSAPPPGRGHEGDRWAWRTPADRVGADESHTAHGASP